jgi:hypothetical protein
LEEQPVGGHKNSGFEIDHQRRVALTRVYLEMACPSIDPRTRTKLANSILALIDNQASATPQRGITDAQAVEVVWRHSQCVLNQTGRCPLLLFGGCVKLCVKKFWNLGWELGFRVTEPVLEIGSTHWNQTEGLVAGGGFEPPTFGLWVPPSTESKDNARRKE